MGETRRRIGYGLGGAVLAAGSLLLPGSGVATAAVPCSTTGSTTTCTYGYTGGEQQFTVPTGVATVQVVAVGASGGVAPASAGSPANTPSSGAQVTGTLSGLSANQVLYVEVGGAASGGACDTGATCGGGFNGGGNGARGAGGGGGASDVRTTTRSETSSLASRLIVAGGGGGGGGVGESSGCDAPLPGGSGGNAGAPGGPGQVCSPGAPGSASSTGGGAGTATAGGAAGTSSVLGSVVLTGAAGALGVGADVSDGAMFSGAGGGGLWGGGSGADWYLSQTTGATVSAGGGGGGSSSGGAVGPATGAPSVTITYTAPLGEPRNPLAELGRAVAGVGPGTSLADKVTTAQQALARGDTAGACGALTGFVNQVTAQSGKKIPTATATRLVASARDIQATTRC